MGRRRKLPYPHNIDIREAILRVLSRNPVIHPADFVDEVKSELERMGFFTGLVSAKRVWRVYEEMVRRGDMYDVLGVVQDLGGELEGSPDEGEA